MSDVEIRRNEIIELLLLLDWADQKHSLSVRKITRADYLEWMLQWPPRLP